MCIVKLAELGLMFSVADYEINTLVEVLSQDQVILNVDFRRRHTLLSFLILTFHTCSS